QGEEIARPVGEVFGGGSPVFAPVGCMVAVRTSDQFSNEEFRYGTATTVDVPSGEILEHLGPQSERVMSELEEPRSVTAAEFSPSGDRLMIQVTSDSGLENRLPILGMVDMDTGELTTTWDGDLVTHFTHPRFLDDRSEEHTSELQSRFDLVCRLLLEKKNIIPPHIT